MRIFVDSREPRDIRTVAKRLGFVQMALDFGDYQSDKCVFERKEVSDLVNSIFARYFKSSRLFSQMERMYDYCRKSGKIGFLLVTGKLSSVEKQFKDRGQKLNRLAIFGAVASVVVRYDFNIIWTEQPAEEWFKIIWKIAEKVEENKLLLPKRKKLKEYSKIRSIAIVSRVLEISPRLAERLLKKFGSLYGILHALKFQPADVLVIEGVGKRTFKKMCDIAGVRP